jgi:predicted AAA+ superfamily ATPase
MIIRRTVEKNIVMLAGKFPVISITGPRQSGKTTLSKLCFPDYEYVNLEMPDSRSFAQSDPRNFLNKFEKGVIIDEIQYVPELFSYIQGIVDEYSGTGQFVITGSQNFLLMEKISQSLAGRVAIINLLPFSLDELNAVGLLPKNYENYMFNGSYPRIFDRNINPPDFYPSYIQTYLERDVRNISNIMNLTLFKTFLEIAAGRIGQVINFTSISNELGVDQKTVKNWFSILEASFIVFFVRPFTRNYNKRLIKSPKMYFSDTGLACSLLGINRTEDVSRHFLRGALFENLVFLELMKSFYNQFRQPRLYFWRDNTGNEIDCIIHSGDSEKVIEIKSGTTITSDFFKGLNYYRKLSGLPGENFYLVYGGRSRQSRSSVEVLGWHQLPELAGDTL